MRRAVESPAPIEWEPDDTVAGRDAVQHVVGNVDNWPVEVDGDVARDIRDRYLEVVES
jgi:hypothetical protein